MTTIFNSMEQPVGTVALESLPDYQGIKERFEGNFTAFVREKKLKAVISALQEEFGPTIVLDKPQLVQDVIERLDDAALGEKPYVFISVNPKVLL